MLKLRVQPIHPWTIGQTAAFPAFQLTSEATANCLQQSEASSRNDAKELQNGSFAAWKQPRAFCALKTLSKLCPPDFIHTFYSHSYNSHAVEVMDKFFDKGVGTSPAKTALKRNRAQCGQQSEASSRNSWNQRQNCGCWVQRSYDHHAQTYVVRWCSGNASIAEGVLNTAKVFHQMTSETLRKHPYHSDIHWYYSGKSCGFTRGRETETFPTEIPGWGFGGCAVRLLQPQLQRLLVDLTVRLWDSVGDSGFLSQLPSSKAS